MYEQEIKNLLGETLYAAWEEVRTKIGEKFDAERLWQKPSKNWAYEYKFRRGGKTLCGLYAKEGCAGLMIIFGEKEREKVESVRSMLSPKTLREYDEAQTYRDGKWAMFLLNDVFSWEDFLRLLSIKRKPDR